MTTHEHQQTGTSNVDYDLASVIYHSLESALSSSIYVTDAQWIGDQELARFFWNNQQEDRRAADLAEALLSERLSKEHQGQQGQQSQQSQQGQQGQQYGQQGQFGGGYGYGRGMYGGGYGYGRGMYGGGYGYGRGMYGGGFGGYGYGPGMYGGYGMGGYGTGWNTPGMYGGFGGYGYGPGMYGGGYGYGPGMYSGTYGGGMYGGTGVPTLRQVTGTSDVTYDLISTLYHSADAALIYHKYIQDAQNANDQDCLKFLQDLQGKCKQRAERARQLLAPRLSHKRWRLRQFQSQQSSQQKQTAGAGSSSSSQSSGSGS